MFCYRTRIVTIISDFIAKYVSNIDGVVLEAFQGDDISRLTNRLLSRQATLENFDYVIFHVGTNNVSQRAYFDHLISDYVNLIKACRRTNPDIKILLSAIIPRPVDHNVTDTITRKVNSYLQETLSNELNFKFVCTYKPFTHAGKVRRELYAVEDGGLRLNMEGTNMLRFFFLRVISTLSD